jgi:hypothetical protein
MKRIFAVLTIALLLAGSAFAQKAAYRLKSGQEYKYLIESKSDAVQEMGGQTQSSSTETTIKISLTIAKVLENGNMQGTLKIENALILLESDQGSKSFGNEASGKSMKLTMNGKGEIVDRDTSTKDQTAESMQVFAQISQLFPRIDGDKLSEGSKWEVSDIDTTDFGGPDNMIFEKHTSKYSVAGKESKEGRNCYKIDLVKDSDVDGKMARGGQDLTVKGEKHLKGTFYHAIDEGILVAFEATTDVDQTVSLSGMSTKIPITTKTSLKVTLDTK